MCYKLKEPTKIFIKKKKKEPTKITTKLTPSQLSFFSPLTACLVSIINKTIQFLDIIFIEETQRFLQTNERWRLNEVFNQTDYQIVLLNYIPISKGVGYLTQA